MAVLALKLQNSGQTGIRKPLQSAPRGEHTFLIILFHILTKATAILFYFIFFLSLSFPNPQKAAFQAKLG